jgi:hypothetical protein
MRWRTSLRSTIVHPTPLAIHGDFHAGVLQDLREGQGGELASTTPAPLIVERSTPGIEVELKGGRRVRFDRDTDPETVRRLVSLLEGEAR